MFKAVLLAIFIFSINLNLYASNLGAYSGYKLPRYVSLKSNNINLRIGSSTNYPIILKYNKKNLPLEIIDEFDVWRKVRDIEGNEGWILGSLLKGDRFAIIINQYKILSKVYSKPYGKNLGLIGRSNIVKINNCLEDWCKIQHLEKKVWIKKENLWGVYKDEKINPSFFQPLINLIWRVNF